MEQINLFTKEKSNDWKWTMQNDYPKQKNGLKVFSCFACGGGSTMGYKLAGCDVIGDLELDARMNKVYVKNHHPKYNFLMDIRDFNKKEDLPEELYNLDIMDFSPPCFEKGTLIKTMDGYKNIEDISIGDYVFTHKSNYKKVYNVMNKITDKYYELKIQGCLPFKVTANHPFYVRRMSRHNKFGKRKFEEPKWVETKDLSIVKNNSNSILEQDYIGFPIIKQESIPKWEGVEYTQNVCGKKIVKFKKHNINLSLKEFWYFVGRYIGDGWQRKSRREIIVCCGKNERQELENIIKNAGFTYTLTEERTTYRATISNIELFEYLKQFGSGAKNKHLTKDVFNLPREQLRSFIDGYLSADGYYDKKSNSYRITSISKELICGMQQCIAKSYHQPTTITIKHNKSKIENREVKCNIAYSINFKKTKCKQQHFYYDNYYLWLPFRNKKLIESQLQVFNISVQEDESYTVYNIACHNCSVFSMAGQREDAWGKKKKFREGQKEQTLDDLFFVSIETVKKLKPKVAIMENVEGLTLGNAWKYVQEIYKRFHEIGYRVKHWLLKGETMGVPQKRHRVFFVATRLPFNLDCIDMYFNYEPITYGEFKSKEEKIAKGIMSEAIRKNKGLKVDEAMFIETGKHSGITHRIVKLNEVYPTQTAGHGDIWTEDGNHPSDFDVLHSQTFPEDYNLLNQKSEYICGMSVPPVMMKRVVTRLIESGIFKNGEGNK